jgi:hypothetical protein
MLTNTNSVTFVFLALFHCVQKHSISLPHKSFAGIWIHIQQQNCVSNPKDIPFVYRN